MELSVLYNPVENECLANFRSVIMQTHCIFAKTSLSWGSRNWKDNLTLEENVLSSLPMFIKFTVDNQKSSSLGFTPPDNFIFEIRGSHYASSLAMFGNTIRRVLQVLSDSDPLGIYCLQHPNVGDVFNGWQMEFNGIKLFIVTFCSLYPKTSPRYQFNAPSDSCFILFQGSATFGRVSIGNFTPNYAKKPTTNRDKIRYLYEKYGRPFNIKLLPLLLKPIDEFNDDEKSIQWWIPLPSEQKMERTFSSREILQSFFSSSTKFSKYFLGLGVVMIYIMIYIIRKLFS